MRTPRLLFGFIPAMLLMGCGDPRDKILPQDLAAASDARETLAHLTPAEQQTIARYEIRRAADLAQGDESARKTVTYREAIADQLVYDTALAQTMAVERAQAQAKQAEADAKAAKEAAVAAANVKLLRESITCWLAAKHFGATPKSDASPLPLPQVVYDFACRNVSADIAGGFKGKLLLKGPFGEWIAEIPVRRDEPLKPGASFEQKSEQAFVNIGEGLSAHAFYELPVEKISTEVQLDSLIKTDGQVIQRSVP